MCEDTTGFGEVSRLDASLGEIDSRSDILTMAPGAVCLFHFDIGYDY